MPEPVPQEVMDKLGQARAMILLAMAGQGTDLSLRQMAVLLNVYAGKPPHTVRSLSECMQVPKAAVTRALDTLSQKGFVRRKRSEDDRRIVFVQRTVAGAVFMREFADRMLDAEKENVNVQ